MSDYTTEDRIERQASEGIETLASLSINRDRFEELLRLSALSGELEHSEIYLNILDDRLEVLQEATGEVVLTYCTFEQDFFDNITLEREVRTIEGQSRHGYDFEFEVGAEAILDVDQIRSHLPAASSDGTIGLIFYGMADNRLAERVHANGTHVAEIMLPGGQDDLDFIPHWLPSRFSQNEVYTNTEGDEAPTRITTDAGKVETAIRPIKDDRGINFYPIVVEDGEFMVDAESVDGPDVENYYVEGFDEVFDVMRGPVELQTAPRDNPMAVVGKGDDTVIRHIIGPAPSPVTP